MKQLVCLSHLPWQAAPTRTQQLLTRLRGVDILFFEPPRSSAGRAPRQQTGRKVRSSLTVYTLPPAGAGAEDFPLLRRRSQARLTAFVLKALERHRFREPLLWTTSPEQLFLVDALPHRGLVYDCSREWDELPLAWESELAARADVCFAASQGLADRLAPCCDNIALIPNGVNYLIFAQSEMETPPELRRLAGPILCRVGEIPADLDLEPMLYAAAQRPVWNFLLLGHAAPAAAQALERCPNIHLLGFVPANQIPDYLAASHLCFDLITRHSLGTDILPSHAFEYLASGKPIVVMLDHDQVEPYPDVIYAAHTPAEFLSRCQSALREDPGWVSGRRRSYAQRAGWSFRAQEVSRILEDTGLF